MAVSLAAYRGWDAITPASLAETTGISRSWFSRRLRTQEDIFRAVLEHEMRRVVAELTNIPMDLSKQARTTRILECMRGRWRAEEQKAMFQLAHQFGMVFTGPAHFALVEALEPVAGAYSSELAAAWSGLVHAKAISPSPWNRHRIGKCCRMIAAIFAL